VIEELVVVMFIRVCDVSEDGFDRPAWPKLYAVFLVEALFSLLTEAFGDMSVLQKFLSRIGQSIALLKIGSGNGVGRDQVVLEDFVLDFE